MKSAPDGFAGARDDLDGQADAVLVGAAPFVVATVDVRGDELVDEVALGSHDLDAVVAGLAGEHGAAHEGTDLPLDAACGQGARRKRRDRRLDARRRHRERVIAVASRMQDLQRDVPALGVHGSGDRHDGAPPRRACAGCPAKGRAQPSMFGANPPVTIRPTPPRARSAKYSARRGNFLGSSSRPVCIEPISTRLRSVTNPRSSGASRWGRRAPSRDCRAGVVSEDQLADVVRRSRP